MRYLDEYRDPAVTAGPTRRIHRCAESSACISALVLRGLRKPGDCPAFGRACTPRTPLGATMVSAEGACAAYFQYGRHHPAGVAGDSL